MPTLTPHNEMDPSPRVVILFEVADLDVATDTITVYQISSYGQIEVRNAVQRPAAGGFTVTDYEVPLGVTVTYRAQQYDSVGAVIGLTDPADTQVDIDPQYLVFQDPLAPLKALMIEAHPEIAAKVTESRPASRYQVGTTTIVLSGELGLIEEVPIPVSTRTLADADSLRTILRESPILIRTMPNIVRLPLLFYATVSTIRQVPMDVQYGGGWVAWDVTADEVSRPALDTLVPAVTYQQYVDFYTGLTYGDTLADYTTYLDSIVNPPAAP